MRKVLALLLVLSGVFSYAQEEEEEIDFIAYDTIAMNEVLIKAQHKRMFADKAVYTFDEAALEKARYAKDLLITLPELHYDPIQNKVKSTKGGTTLILINGLEATDMQLRSIKPENVVRVEYFDIPPTRWATRADTVVNLITRNPENGYVFGVDSSSALTTGFVNGSAYANLTRGKNNFGLEYSINLRDYDDRENQNSYTYDLNNSRYRTKEDRRDHFGYTYQDINLRYTNMEPDKHAFQAKFNIEIFTSFSKVRGVSIFEIDDSAEDHTTSKHTNSEYAKPSLDLYYSKKLGEKDELSLNVVGTHYTTKSFELSKEWMTNSGASVFENNMNLEAKQSGIVGEIAHTHDFGKGKLNSGYRISNNSISNDLENLVGFSKYKVNYLEQYFYTEFSGKTKKMMYRLGIGLKNIHNKSEENTTDDWTLTPNLVLGYELAKNQSLRFTSNYMPSAPWSSALSSNVVQIAPNLVRRGNPYLESQQSFGNNLTHSFNTKYFDLNTNLSYRYRKNAISQLYVKDVLLNGYALTYENAKNSQQYRFQITGSIKPFGNDLLIAKIMLAPTKESIKTKEGKTLENDYIANYFFLSSVYKSFSINYQFNIPYYSLNGAFLSTNENMNHLFLEYKVKNWTLNTGIYWIEMPSEYKTKSLDESLVNYTSHTKIHNNKSMFILGLSYDFSTGKKIDLDRKLDNYTAPAATF